MQLSIANSLLHPQRAKEREMEALIPLQVVHGETGGQRLLQLVGLVGVEDGQGVEVLGAPDFELDDILGTLDLDASGVLTPGGEKEILDLADLLRHCGRRSFRPRRGWVRRWRPGDQQQQTPQQQNRLRASGSRPLNRHTPHCTFPLLVPFVPF